MVQLQNVKDMKKPAGRIKTQTDHEKFWNHVKEFNICSEEYEEPLKGFEWE
jgi:hypothetical protein